ncbi:serine O-acetyltransferase [Microbacter margulisiae]|uniref:serine O-acetyltransferase n=1 Tax=Microbacter margulisiae TaxID=1350067 RepID=A0A7W5DSF0_9PORP|nr:serine acetyltransferase [Microbacter margulisiae]MBB3187935.1 serine O-acetyltransferase [Microbacter margulisiae]
MLYSEIITESIRKLADYKSFKVLCHQQHEGTPMPSLATLEEIVHLSRSIIFPGYFGNAAVDRATIKYHIGMEVERLYQLLSEQIMAGLCFSCSEPPPQSHASSIAATFIERLPQLRQMLADDVIATYLGDPASKSYGEVIFCYPALRAISNYRIAHELLVLGVPLIPRIISELAHSETGIDIHPGAVIGNSFTIDHGTGVVIGETTIIGNHVKLYQGVTLGAKSFPLDEKGNPIKGIPRHPVIEDDVIIYSNSTILGRVTVGKGAIIGGNIWIDTDIEPGAKIIQASGKK